MLILILIGYSAAFLLYVKGSLRASKTIHQRLVESVLGTTMRFVLIFTYSTRGAADFVLRWLDRTPTSRVITRCTQDIRDSKSSHSNSSFFK